MSIPRAVWPAAAAVLLVACTSAGDNGRKSCWHLNAAVETDIGYCQAVRAGHLLHISGSVGKGEMAVAMRGAYDEVKKTLEANGANFGNVVKETVFTTDLDAFIQNKAVRRNYYGSDFPAATWVQVQRLYTPAFAVEVEVTAELPK